MNRKLYGIFLAAVFGASSFLTSCSSSSHKTITDALRVLFERAGYPPGRQRKH